MVKSPSLGESDLPRIGIEPGGYQFADMKLPDGRDGRLIEINFMPRVEVEDDEEDEGYGAVIPPPNAITMVFARERETLDATSFAIASTIFGYLGIVL